MIGLGTSISGFKYGVILDIYVKFHAGIWSIWSLATENTTDLATNFGSGNGDPGCFSEI